MSDDLKKYIDANTKYLKFEKDGDVYDVYYLGHKIIPDKFRIQQDPVKFRNATTVEYMLRTRAGNLRYWTQGSAKVAAKMMDFKPGDCLSVTKVKKGEYLIRKLDLPPVPAEEAAASESGEVSEEAPF